MAQGILIKKGSSKSEAVVKSGYLYDMTGENTPSPFVVSDISGKPYFNPVWNVFSSTVTTSPTWNDGAILQIDLGEVKYIPLSFFVSVKMDNGSGTTTVTVSGSNDGASFRAYNSITVKAGSQVDVYLSTNLTSKSIPIRYIRIEQSHTEGQVNVLKCLCNQWIEVGDNIENDIYLPNGQFLYTSGNGSGEFSVTLGSGKKLIALIGTNVYFESQDNNAYLYFTIGSTTTKCSASNGLYRRDSKYRSAGKATTTMIWLNTGQYKYSEFVKASIKGGWGDGVVQLYAIYE